MAADGEKQMAVDTDPIVQTSNPRRSRPQDPDRPRAVSLSLVLRATHATAGEHAGNGGMRERLFHAHAPVEAKSESGSRTSLLDPAGCSRPNGLSAERTSSRCATRCLRA